MNVTCPECARVFDMEKTSDADEWACGHDCEAPEPGNAYVARERALFDRYYGRTPGKHLTSRELRDELQALRKTEEGR